MPPLNKQALRRVLRDRRAAVATEERARAAERACECLVVSPFWLESRTILAYLAMPEELETRPILHAALAQGKQLCLPRCRKGALCFDAVPVSDLEGDFEPGPFRHLLEPARHLAPIAPAAIDLIVVPAVAFDFRGNRLGMGAGMYDRFLPGCPHARAIGLGYAFQVVDALPFEPHDRPVEGIVTDAGWVAREETR